MKRIALIVLIIVLFASRLWQLGSNPGILNRDEAAIGYNAFLLQHTGMDEWQARWPLTLRSFGDYKLIGYPFLVVQLFRVFGASDLIVRLPSAVAGLLTVVAIYLLSMRIFTNKQSGFLIIALAVLTPVLFFYSRIAFEATVSLCYFLFFLVCILRPVDRKTVVFDLIGVLLLIAALFTYNTPFILLPFILLSVPFLRGVKNYRTWAFLFSALFVVLIIAAMVLLKAAQQKNGITIFADENTTYRYPIYRQSFTGLAQNLLGNKYVYYGEIIFKNYLHSFSPEFLVFHGGPHPWHALPGWGHILLPQYILSLSGVAISIWALIKQKIYKPIFLKKIISAPLLDTTAGRDIMLLFWLGISLIPSVITVDAPHATRSLFFFVTLILFGGVVFDRFNGTKFLEKAVYSLLYGSAIILFSSYLYTYFYAYPDWQGRLLMTGFDTTIQKVEKNANSGPVAIVDPGGYQYILLAWYLKVPPQQFFSTVKMQEASQAGLHYGERVLKYRFIIEAKDRFPSEKYSVEWNNGWEIHEY